MATDRPAGDSFIGHLVFWLVVGAIVAAILFFGWRQPLRYRFMSRQEIYALEHPATPSPGTPWMWDPARNTKLDRGAYGGATRAVATPRPYR